MAWSKSCSRETSGSGCRRPCTLCLGPTASTSWTIPLWSRRSRPSSASRARTNKRLPICIAGICGRRKPSDSSRRSGIICTPPGTNSVRISVVSFGKPRNGARRKMPRVAEVLRLRLEGSLRSFCCFVTSPCTSAFREAQWFTSGVHRVFGVMSRG